MAWGVHQRRKAFLSVVSPVAAGARSVPATLEPNGVNLIGRHALASGFYVSLEPGDNSWRLLQSSWHYAVSRERLPVKREISDKMRGDQLPGLRAVWRLNRAIASSSALTRRR